ncbi:MAG TPA: polysaccharide biosynthesis C-terminal domain-containing protein, partial [Bacillota bacterium]|nr:polysaccharide biosynthesis C-terminal domain-containing protein [Bacillota bacterium]
PLAARAIITVSPTIMLICVISAIRGYFQGLQNMIPTAISQMIEALLKLIIGYSAASYAMNKGYTLDIVAAYTISGVTIGVAVSTVFLIICYLVKGRGACELRDERSADDKRLAIRLIRIAVPISLTAAALYLANIVDLMTIVNVLAKKFGQESAELLYSAYSSISVTLANMPSTIIYAIATSILPSLAAALALKKQKKVRESMRASLRLTAVFAFPCAFGVCLLSEGIISCIYSASTISQTVYINSAGEAVTALSISSTALGILAVGIIFITMYSTTNALMQSYGLEWYTIVSVLCGTGTKLVLSLILLNIKAINIYGAAISTVACYVVAVGMNCRYLRKKSGHSLK